MSDIHTYPEMNARLTKILRISENPTSLYAAQRIEEIESENQRLRKALEQIVKKESCFYMQMFGPPNIGLSEIGQIAKDALKEDTP